nr:chalcone isomerase family protein [uncultured Glaciecola sp.]
MSLPKYILSPVFFALSLTAAAQLNTVHAKTPEIQTQLSVSGAVMTNTPLSFEQIAQQYIKNPKVVGKARLKIMFWKIYDAKLSAADGLWNAESPFALSLTYLRDFDGEEIASRSIDEMRDIGYEDEVLLAKWYEQMRAVFPNIKEGENITGVMDENMHTHFYHEGKLIGSIDDKTFTQSFFGIWLHEKTSEPKMRKQLMGLI